MAAEHPSGCYATPDVPVLPSLSHLTCILIEEMMTTLTLSGSQQILMAYPQGTEQQTYCLCKPGNEAEAKWRISPETRANQKPVEARGPETLSR